jgi:hypothetical protein
VADAPIGISFIPSAQNQALGNQAAGRESTLGGGPSSDLAAAYKILSLRLPTVVGATAPTPASNLTGGGASAVSSLPGGLSPHAALFTALLKAAMSGGGFDMSALTGLGGGMGGDASGAAAPPPSTPRPKITLGTDAPDPLTGANASPSTGNTAPPAAESQDWAY